MLRTSWTMRSRWNSPLVAEARQGRALCSAISSVGIVAVQFSEGRPLAVGHCAQEVAIWADE